MTGNSAVKWIAVCIAAWGSWACIPRAVADEPAASVTRRLGTQTSPAGLSAEDWAAVRAQLPKAARGSGPASVHANYLKAGNAGENDEFGISVAVSGDTVVVGAYHEDSGVVGDPTDDSASNAGAAYVFARRGATWSQQAYLKAANVAASDLFGASVAISGDTLVVGASLEDSGATGVDGNPDDDSAAGAGAAYVFVRNNGIWSQQAYLKASNTQSGDNFGHAVAISGDTVVVGAPFEDSNAAGAGGNQADNSANAAGAAYVFTRAGGVWSQQAYLKASNPGVGDSFGSGVAVSGDTLVIGAVSEDSASTGVNGVQSDDSANSAGAAYVFARSGGVWSQQAYLKASNAEANDQFGSGLAVDGDTVVIGAWLEDGGGMGVDANPADESAIHAGAAYVFARSAGAWSQQAYLKSSNTGAGDNFGTAVAVEGDVVLVGARWEDSGTGSPDDDTASQAGAAYVFSRSGTAWSPSTYLKAPFPGANDFFGNSVAISGDTVVVGARLERSASTGVGGDPQDDSAYAAGATYTYDAALRVVVPGSPFVDGRCALREAVINANDDAETHPDCGPGGGFGNGHDLIVFDPTFAPIPQGARIAFTDVERTTVLGDTDADGDADVHFFSTANSAPLLLLGAGASLSLDRVVLRNAGQIFGSAILGESSPAQPGELRLSRVTVRDNLAKDSGAIELRSTRLDIEDSTFSGNESIAGEGGAIYQYDFGSSLAVRRSTFSGNHAGGGAGAMRTTVAAEIADSTFADNTSDAGAAALLVGNGTTTLRRTVIAGSGAMPNCVASAGTTLVDGGGNLQFGDASCGGMVQGDPKLGPLQDNGGPTHTRALAADSAALDAIACGSTLDQRGVARAQDVPGRGGSGASSCDVGAVEMRAYTLATASSANGDIDAGALPVAVQGGIVDCTDTSGSCSATYLEATPAPTIELTATPGVGYRLASWSGDCATSASPLAVTLDANLACTATFVRNDVGVVAQVAPFPALDAAEGNGSSRSIPIHLTLSETAPEPVTVTYNLLPAAGSAGKVPADAEFVGSVSFPPGATTALLSVPINPDAMVEPDEAFALSFSITSDDGAGSPNAVLDEALQAPDTVVLRNDDSAVLSIVSTSAFEDHAGFVSIEGSLTAPVQGGVSSLYATAEITGGATREVDYNSTAGNFTHGGTEGATPAFLLTLIDDGELEASERFAVELVVEPCPVPLTPCPVTAQDGQVTILDNEGAPAGLVLGVDDGLAAVDPGDVVRYVIRVVNRSDVSADPVSVVDFAPAALLSPEWTCAVSSGGACSAALGTGPLGVTLDLPPGGLATLTLRASVGAFAPTLDYTVVLTPPEGYVDADPADNSATDSNLTRTILRDGFEDP